MFNRNEKKLRNNEHWNEFKKDSVIVLNRLKNGAYFYGRKTDFSSSYYSMKKIAKYLARYCSHPSISERRILKYDSKKSEVTRFFDPHEDDTQEDETKLIGRQYITESALKFMERLVIHIPDEGFKSIRYYGFYSNKGKIKPVGEKLFSSKDLEEQILHLQWKFGILYSFGFNPLLCECGTEMIYSYEKSYTPGVDTT